MISALVLFSAMLPGPVLQDAEAVYKNASPSVMTLEIAKEGGTSVGTAFLISESGLAITAYHVIDGAKSGYAYFSDGEQFEVSGMVDSDPKRDIALIKVKVADRPFLQFAEGTPAVGSKAFVIGAPRSLDFSISDGIIAQVRKLDSFVQYQYTCPTSPGNSGGPLLNANSQVLGVVCWGLTDSQNLNFATAGTYAKGLDRTLPTKPWTGASSGPAATTDKSMLAQQIIELRFAASREYLAMSDIWTLITRVGADNVDIPATVWTAIDELQDISKRFEKMTTPSRTMNDALRKNADIYLTRALGLAEVVQAADRAKRTGWDGQANALLKKGVDHWATPLEWGGVTDELRSWTSEVYLKQYHAELFEFIFPPAVPEDTVVYDIGFQLDMRVHPALRVAFLVPASIAEKADIRPSDTILSVDGKTFSDWTGFRNYLSEHREKEVKIKVKRLKGGEATLKLKVPRKGSSR